MLPSTNVARVVSLKQQCRWKTAKFKPKVAKTRPDRTPTALALDHFDFYYGPHFGSRWPSVRLGLLCPNKYVAVMNTFSKNWETHEQILEDLGTVNILSRICGKGKGASEKIEKKKEMIDAKANEETMNALQQDAEERDNLLYDENEQDIMRSASGLAEFRHSGSMVTPGQLQMGLQHKSKDKEVFDITGYEGEGFRLHRRSHFMYYPLDLRLLSYDRGVTTDFPPPLKDDNGVSSWWLLDGGSVVPVLALGLEKGESLLDVCAAPGGKSLLALLTNLPDKVVCNDYKLSRLGQLKRSLTQFVPSESLAADKVLLKRKDASDVQNWDELSSYDKVLVDVPCSTDRLAVSQDEGNLFASQNTSQRLDLPKLQTKILVNSLRAAKVGGSVVYSTCTLSSMQNEAVVENAVAIAQQKFGIKVVEESLEQLQTHLASSGLFKFADNCRVGALVLPYLPSNFGPMYIYFEALAELYSEEFSYLLTKALLFKGFDDP